MTWHTPSAFRSPDPMRATMMMNAWRLFAAAQAAHVPCCLTIDMDSRINDGPWEHTDWILEIGHRRFVDGIEVTHLESTPTNSAWHLNLVLEVASRPRASAGLCYGLLTAESVF